MDTTPPHSKITSTSQLGPFCALSTILANESHLSAGLTSLEVALVGFAKCFTADIYGDMHFFFLIMISN